jgi:hypothetical protein
MTKVTRAGADLLDDFRRDARMAELNGGTLIFGGRVQAPAAAKLVRDGLLVRVGTSRITYRLTEAGKAWVAEHTAKLEAEKAVFAQLIADRQAAAALRFQVVHLGFRYYAVRDTKTGRNVATTQGTADALDRATADAAERNADAAFITEAQSIALHTVAAGLPAAGAAVSELERRGFVVHTGGTYRLTTAGAARLAN